MSGRPSDSIAAIEAEIRAIAEHIHASSPSTKVTKLLRAADRLAALGASPAVDAWIPVSERLPSHEEFGPYPIVDVILQCDQANGREPWQRRVGHAVLRFIGGDRSRPYWTEEKHVGNNMLENSSWRVTHWRRIPEFPAAITPQATAP